MPRKVTTHTSRGAEPDEQPPKYGLRKRTAHRVVSDGKNVEDVRHQTLSRRTQRTPTNTRAQLSSSRGRVEKETRTSSGQRRARKDKNKEWLAEAIVEENNTHYLIKYAPVYEGAQREISWQPKRNANAALVAWWETRQTSSALKNSNSDDYGQVKAFKQIPDGNVANRDGHGRPSPRPGTSISTILSQEPSTLSSTSRDDQSTTSGGNNGGQASPRTLAHEEVSNNTSPGVSAALPGKLADARERLRLLLRGSGRRRFRKSSSRFPPSP